MPLSAQDVQLWLCMMHEVQPIHKAHVMPCHVHAHTVTNRVPSPRENYPTPIRLTWDLHGMTVQQAHVLVMRQIDQLHDQVKYITFITGRSGIMHTEFPHWVSQSPWVKSVESVHTGGTYRVWFKRVNKRS